MLLQEVYDGWDGYHRALVSAIDALSAEQLAFRVHPNAPSAGEIALHIADGRVDWLSRIGAAKSPKLEREISERDRHDENLSAAELVEWLNRTWEMADDILKHWSTRDVHRSYLHPYQGKTYRVSYQWTIFRILAHDIHHGGQLSENLMAQGIEPEDLTLLGGHLTEPPTV